MRMKRASLTKYMSESLTFYESTLQHTATHCNTLQHTATHCNTLRHTAAYCNILQHTATNCDTLQHTATHCKPVRHLEMHRLCPFSLCLQYVYITCIYAYIHTYINIQRYINIHVITQKRISISTFIHTCMHACMQIYGD